MQKMLLERTAQRIFRRHTIFLGAENDAVRRVVIGVVDFGGIVVQIHIELSGSFRRQFVVFSSIKTYARKILL